MVCAVGVEAGSVVEMEVAAVPGVALDVASVAMLVGEDAAAC